MSVTKFPAGRLALACSSVAALMYGGSAFATGCMGAGAPATGYLECYTAVQIPADPNNGATASNGGIRSFDISWVDATRGLYFLGDRSNFGIDIIDLNANPPKFVGRAGGFVGILPAGAKTVAANNNISGPDGVTSHGRWLYAGDGNSTLKVFDTIDPANPKLVATISTGGTTRVDEMSLTTDGTMILVANNAEDPPFSTLMHANGDSAVNTMSAASIITQIKADPTIIPAGNGLSMEQPTWDASEARYYNSIPQIANNPAGCDFAGAGGKPICQGGLAVIDPTTLAAGHATLGAYSAATNAGIISLADCGPNGATVGPNNSVGLACTPQNVATNTTTQVFNTKTLNFVEVGHITGGDEIWYNSGDRKYYVGASRACGKASGCPTGGAVLGVINADTNMYIEGIAASSNSHSVAADSKHNYVLVPEVGSTVDVGAGGETETATLTTTTDVCGGTKGCVVVYRHRAHGDNDSDRGDDDRGDRGDHGGHGGHEGHDR